MATFLDTEILLRSIFRNNSQGELTLMKVFLRGPSRERMFSNHDSMWNPDISIDIKISTFHYLITVLLALLISRVCHVNNIFLAGVDSLTWINRLVIKCVVMSVTSFHL